MERTHRAPRAARASPITGPRWLGWVGLIALLLFLAALGHTVRQASKAPAENWDMLAYMALALEWEVKDPVELHRRTYERARAELAPETFQELTAAGVRQVRAQDPAAFHEHLAFFRARVLYTLVIRWLHVLGLPLSAATWWISIAAYAMLALLALAWCAGHVPLALAAAFALGVAWTPGLLNQATYSTADGLAALFVGLGAFFLVERRLFAFGAAILTLAVAARPDTVILIAFLAAALALFLTRGERPPIVALVAWVALSAGATVALQRFSGEYGWWPLIQISFLEKSAHPAALATAVDWDQYGAILARQMGSLPGDGYQRTPAGDETGSTIAFLYGALALCGAALGARARARHGREAALLAALLATYLVRYLLFPQIWDRFFAAFYVLVPLLVLAIVVRELRAPPPEADEPATPRRSPAH